MGNLEKLHETILSRKLLRRAFQRKMLSLGILRRVAEQYSGKANNAPCLYQFNSNK